MINHSFTNIQIDQKTLPSGNDIIFQPLDPRHFTSALLVWNFVVLVPAILLGILWFDIIPGLEEKPEIKTIILIFVIILFVIAIFNLAAIRCKGYALRTYDVAGQGGLLVRSVTTIPFSRVQHVEINRGPIARMFGLASLSIYTAGGMAIDLKIPGLKAEDAGALRLEILQRIHEISLTQAVVKDREKPDMTPETAEKESDLSEGEKILPVSP